MFSKAARERKRTCRADGDDQSEVRNIWCNAGKSQENGSLDGACVFWGRGARGGGRSGLSGLPQRLAAGRHQS